MAEPSSRETLKQYALRNLGKPVIDINVDDDQLEDRLDEALQYFAQYHYDGVERCYLKYQFTEADKTRMKSVEGDSTLSATKGGVTTTYTQQNNYIVVPETVLAVTRIFPISDRHSMNMFDIRYQLRLNDLFDLSSTSIMHYQMTMDNLDLIQHILVGETPIRFNQHQNRLYLDMDWENDITPDVDYILIECYRKLDPATYTDIYDDMFLKRYATALIKKQWGTNLSKFNGVTMLGGVTMNGETLYTQGLEEQNSLEEKMQESFEISPAFLVG